MPQELEKTYNPLENEDKIYKLWEASGYFNPDNLDLPETAKTYTIILPPPNVTDKLHMGHAATIAIEDLLIRYHRLLGERALWLPGTDHAAIATQNVVEKKLLKEKGRTRQDLGREAFLAEVWKFLKETRTTILGQIRQLGASLDWSRLAFTLDEKRQLAVATMFKDMYEAGAIYRGERIVNWCPRCHSTLADDEVEHKEQKAKFYIFKYNPDFPFAIATTRPETKLGDTAVAVNPKDERYKKYIGRQFQFDFCGQSLSVKIIAERRVDMSYGTGALGVTPAHSLTDWQMAQANKLPVIKVINETGCIQTGFGLYAGLTAAKAREKLVAKLKKRGLLIKEEEINNNLAVCYRCGTAIEPLPSKQWFVAVDKKLAHLGNKSLKEKAGEAARSGAVKFIPGRFQKRYLAWLEDLHDWCISRQIWFGHQIPVWYQGEETYIGLTPPAGAGWQQDPDTLDTWFSSGMWTFSTLGWPENYKNGEKMGDLARFHPTQVLETGYEILTLWVSRMVMMSFFALGEIPFENVYLHGTILDEKGKKMSKSKGNGIDLTDMVSKYGADAARLSLLAGYTPGNDARFYEKKVAAKRNFINKLWNISRFILSLSGEEYFKRTAGKEPVGKTFFDKWILEEMSQLIFRTASNLNNFNFSLAAEDLEDFTWNKLADWYLEVAKIEKNKEEILIYLLKNLLILWHPFTPFITETIWQRLDESNEKNNGTLLLVERWPKFEQSERPKNRTEWRIITKTIAIIEKIRNARQEHKIDPKKLLKAQIYLPKGEPDNIIDQRELIISLRTGLKSIEFLEKRPKITADIMLVVGAIEIYLSGERNLIDVKEEKDRLLKESANLEKLIILQKQKLAQAEFIAKAPAKIVAREKEKLAAYQQELEKIIKMIKAL